MDISTPYNLTAYLIAMGASALCACALLFFSFRKEPAVRADQALSMSACVLLLGCLLGILGAKLFYFIFNLSYLLQQDAGAFWTSLRAEELSYYGGVAGVTLAAALTGKLFGLRPVRALNAFAPAGALMAAAARFAEYFLYPVGTGAYLDAALPFPLAVGVWYSEDYTEYVLAVFMFEGLVSLAAFALSLAHRGEPRRFLRTLFYLCMPQVLLESLRNDSISLLFIKLEQLTCFLFVEGVLVWYGWACRKKGFSAWIPAVAGLVVCGLTVLEEFMLDGKVRVGGTFVPEIITYSMMAAGLAVLAVMEHRGNRLLYLEKSALAK